MLRDQNVLLVSPEEWGENFVSKHHYAIELSKRNNKVFFVNPPGQAGSARIKISTSKYANIFIVDYKPFFKGLRFLPAFIAVLLQKLEITLVEKACKVKFGVIWNFETSRFYYFNAWNKNVLKILHIVDLNQNFQVKTAASTANICFCTTDFIKKELERYNSKVFKVHHGFSSFGQSYAEIKISQTKRIRTAYIGTLSIKYLDWNLFDKLISENDCVDFYLIGPINYLKVNSEDLSIIERVKSRKNVYFIGVVPAESIPGYLNSMDVLLVLYKAEEFMEQLASPHKMMEYLGSGKVIVSTYTDEYKDRRELIRMADNSHEILSIFEETVSNLGYYNSPELMLKRKYFAESHSYKNQLQKIEEILRIC